MSAQTVTVETEMQPSTSSAPSEISTSSGAPPAKKSKLFAKYSKPGDTPSDVEQDIAKFASDEMLSATVNFETEDAIAFWQRLIAAKTLNKLQSAALRVLSIPASSSPVERVFSHGGIIMRPHPARLSDSKLSKLIFLKCNGSATE